jgi:hypothetical protein
MAGPGVTTAVLQLAHAVAPSASWVPQFWQNIRQQSFLAVPRRKAPTSLKIATRVPNIAFAKARQVLYVLSVVNDMATTTTI